MPRAQTGLYQYLFHDLWRSLTPTAQKVLIYMRTAPNGVTMKEVLSARQLGTRDAVLMALDALVGLALLDVRSIDETTAEYSIHPLTHHFVVSDLPRIWAEEDDN